jgi:hypothetical protein
LRTAIELAKAAQAIRGFGPVKEASISRHAAQRAQLLSAFGASPGDPLTQEPIFTP